MSAHLPRTNDTISAPRYAYAFGRFQFQIDENGQTLLSEGHVIALSTAESTILRVLLERHGEFVKTEELLKSISPSPMASENLVHGAVRGLRRTLNDAELIKNERSKGYAFTGEVQKKPITIQGLPEPRSVQVADAPSPINPTPQAHERMGRDSFVIVALLVTAPVVLLPFGLLFFGGNWESLPRQLGFIEAVMILVAIAYDFYFSDVHHYPDANAETRRAQLAVQ